MKINIVKFTVGDTTYWRGEVEDKSRVRAIVSGLPLTEYDVKMLWKEDRRQFSKFNQSTGEFLK